ncbi:histone deacetylase [Streptomyces sp. NPDC053048]|uniref:histone deacetylase n=1 Tax=Streptomyces sp. NPDC053048 TaxID=3365694 RepID=UPI0037D00999
MVAAYRLVTSVAPGRPSCSGLVWYASYGSNMDPERLRHYLVGGRPDGGARTYPGCRDQAPPRESVPVEMGGALYFATESAVWTGGRAFYDPHVAGTVRGYAHLVTAQQFSDIVAQEMYRAPGVDLDLAVVLSEGRQVLGDGRYETLVCPGELDGVPVLTFTAPWALAEVPHTVPSAPYLWHLVVGLRLAGAWSDLAIASYLARAPGACGNWTAEGILGLMDGPPSSRPGNRSPM